ncbi:MAG: hypothetical protein ABI912_01895 [Actinomycetota bacterium]
MICIDPRPSYLGYQDMANFVAGTSDERAARGRSVPGGHWLLLLVNHLKSKGYGRQADNDDRRH